MKGRIIDSQYLPGYSSWVLKQTKYGLFSAEVFLHDEDKDIDNSFDGCRIAEFDCDTKAYKEKAKLLRQRAVGARIVLQNNWPVLDDTDAEIEIEKTAKQLEKEAARAKEYYERRRDYRPIFIKNLLQKRRDERKFIKERLNK